MKKSAIVFWLSIIIIEFFVTDLYAVNLKSTALDIKQNTVSNMPANTEYQVVVQGKRISDGNFSPDKIYNIEKVSKDNYIQNAIHIKTKKIYSVDKYDRTLSSASLQSALEKYDLKRIYAPFQHISSDNTLSNNDEDINRIYEIQYGNEQDPYEVCKELMKNPEIEYAVPIFKRYVYFTPNDPRFNSQYALTKIAMKQAWDYSSGDTSVVIGIVDTGVDWHHEDLSANIFTNWKEKPNNGIDDDGNGKIDDVHGWDFVGNVNYNQIYSNQFIEDNDPINILAIHGTHVAGCAAPVTNNNTGIAGPGFKCKILPVKCATDMYSSSGIFRGYEGITYAANMGAQIINCSWGGPGSSPVEQDIINNAVKKGSLVVVAAGNNAFNIDQGGEYPAGYENVLTVGASDENDGIAGFSNYGQKVTVYTPGNNILATIPNNQYTTMSGTSMASPITAGIAALVKSLHPNWTPKQIIHQIRSTSDNVLTTDPNLRRYFYGRTNAYKALLYNNGGAETVPGVEIDSYTFAQGNSISDYTPTKVILKVKNYIGVATQLKLNFTNLSNYIALSKQSVDVGTLGTLDSATVELTLQLMPNNLWKSGTADFLVTFVSGTYVDYQVLKFPINIASSSDYNHVLTFNETQIPNWLGASSPDPDIMWAVGEAGLFGGGSGYYKQIGNTQPYFTTFNDRLTAVWAFDDLNVFMGSGPSNGQSKIYYTTDGGLSAWKSVQVDFITSFVNSIHFFDANNAVFLGDPKNGKWGIGSTTNRGKVWSFVNTGLNPQSGETGLTNSDCWIGNNGWFGTTKGRVFRTTDKGTTWMYGTINKAINVELVAFQTSSNGIAVYTETNGQNADRLVASTTDKGATWTTNKFNFGTSGLIPVYAFYPDSSKMIYVLCSMGQTLGTSDLGATWVPVLSEKDALMMTGASAVLSNNRARIWEIGRAVGYLDFSYLPNNARRELSITSVTPVSFDTVLVKGSKVSNINIKNTGNVDLNLFGINVVPVPVSDSLEFSFLTAPPTMLSPNQAKTLRLRFNPKDTGWHYANIVIVSDASTDTLTIPVSGFAKDTLSSVNDDLNFAGLSIEQISPNPCSDETYLTYSNSEKRYVEVTLINSLGVVVANVFGNDAEPGTNIVHVNTASLPDGIYFFKIKSGLNTAYKKFVVYK